MLEDTIAAISTPLGEGGIGIVRISGTEALKVSKKIFKAKSVNLKELKSHKMIYGHVYDDLAGEVVDEALFCYMKAPHSYTREDIVEINCHGGIVPLRKTLELVLKEGVRLAGPGEFSKRAFLNGRLDLAQAESIIDLIRSKTETGLKLAVSQLKGDLSKKIYEIQDKLLGILAQVEVNIDFPEEDLEEATSKDIICAGEVLVEQIKILIDGAEAGIIYRDGIRAAIIGKPNVGKSSLLNALLKEKRAIVTDVPGTTRDVIEEIINIRGIPLRIIDTAGLRETEDLVEKIGVERTREAAERADLVLTVLDASEELSRQDLDVLALAEEKKCLVVINKIDLKDRKIDKEVLKEHAGTRPVIWVSAEHGTGLSELENLIADLALCGKINTSDGFMVTNIRHKAALEKASFHLNEAIASIKKMVPVDIVAIDLRDAWEALGEITGASVSEDLIDRIFSDFCVGK
ncbi:MAG: tRNA modification GTPase MnmE [Pelotomaculum sp. PtaB.Bin013]|uniref:tRNA modification GTPase MnmE n=1 Tax=Pelotomaculum isophthalicicum JI TaxID=947010 RepID=A0A9X4H5M1_9FIRM|nr:tRNA uridine-5-carboxymethylaminomethyl(34) synthesis GTPase MnmE [Pelotomaculum isophthalicicum]MDF9407754.1 tRNA uridine-5-carboxymethylaminomethyl(34) synthesis GTPase MnmE [Pelotomaculum isophthalicicum JI]OPX92038.1 MAG: tRNA modification GTPase MnmE [Pelotomaculum sp. PtaB.Bin013]